VKDDYLNVRIPMELKRQLNAIAASEHRTLGNLVTMILQRYIEANTYPEREPSNLALNDAPPEPPTPRKRKKADPETN